MTAAPADAWRLADRTRTLGSRVLISGVDPALSLSDDLGAGVVMRFRAPARARHRIVLGGIPHLAVFTCLHRTSPFWMVPSVGHAVGEVPRETQWMLAQLADGSCLLLAPLVAGRRRWTLESENGRLSLNGDANDNDVLESEGDALFLAHGHDPYALMAEAARILAARMGWLTRAARARVPMLERLGWCTYNCFYNELDQAKMRAALTSLRDGGVPIRWLLIDGGWQALHTAPGGEKWLSAIAADPARFPDGLAETISMAREEFGVTETMVWHALFGFISGCAEGSVPFMPMLVRDRRQQPGIYAAQPTIDDWFGARVSMPAAKDAPRFYSELHGYLKSAGCDAVKVDFQSTAEAVCQGQGGRVDFDRAWRTALEASCERRFAGGLINCMSCSSECLYTARGSALTRTSDDYYPERPDLQGLHLHANAQMGMWFGEFVQPDWDMFQSAHPYGGFHGAARVLSGGPVLLTDELHKHDAALIRRLALADGTLLIPDLPGRPAPSSLFADPTRHPRALAICNRAGEAGLLGLFHACHGSRLPIEAEITASEVPHLAGREVIAVTHHGRAVARLRPGQSLPVTLGHGAHELAVLAPIRDGLAPIGLTERYGAPAALRDEEDRQGTLSFRCRGAGRLAVWSERKPRAVTIDGQAIDWSWDAASGLGGCMLPHAGTRVAIVR